MDHFCLRVEPFDGEEAERIVSEELGVRVSKAFEAFDRTPIAAASLGQVHRAVLRGGRTVAVKVQRPGIREQIVKDLDALGEVVDFMDRHTRQGRKYEPARVLEEFRRTLLSELDYAREARNMATLDANLAEFERIIVPRPVDDYSTGRVLTMEWIRGRNISKLSPLARMEVDGRELAEELFRAYLKQILVDGFFHADPHPGNVFLTDDGRLALLDVGMVGTLSPDLQQQLLRLVLAISDGRGDEAAEITIQVGERRGHFDEAAFTGSVKTLVADFTNASSAQDIQVGRVMLEVTRSAAENGSVAGVTNPFANAATTQTSAAGPVKAFDPPPQQEPLPEGVYYHHQLIGCDVVTQTGQALGRVSGVQGDGEATRIEGAHKVEAVVLDNGQRLAADLVIVGIGGA